MSIYCLHCKRKTPNIESKIIEKNGHKMIMCHCAVCHHKKSCFISSSHILKKNMREHKGGSIIDTALNKLNSVIPEMHLTDEGDNGVIRKSSFCGQNGPL